MNKKVTTVLAIVIALLVAGIGYLGYSLNEQKKENKDMQELAALDKKEMENEYQQFAAQYSEMKTRISNDSIVEQLSREQRRTQALLEELRQTKATDAATITRLKKELAQAREMLQQYALQVDSLNRTLPADRQLYIVCGKSNIKDASLYLKQDTMSAVSLWMTTIIQAQQDSTDVPRMTAQLLDDFSRAIALSPGNAYLHYNQGNAYVNCLEFQQAVEAYTVAIRIDPHLAEAYYNRGLARLALKQQDEAVSDLSKAGELGLYTAYSLLKNQRK